MIDPRQRFTPTADLYHRYRPGYPPEIVSWIAAVSGVAAGARVLDLGCGTGISSRLFAAHGYRVIGVDPNRDMLAHALAAGGDIEYRRGEATATGLGDASVDLVIAAQAFHWFPLLSTLQEIARVSRPDGWACAFWNQRHPSRFNDEYEVVMRRHSPEYAAIRDYDYHGVPRLREALPAAAVRETEIHRSEALDWETLIGRCHSASYVATAVADMAGFDAEVRAVFDRHQEDGRLVLPYRVEAIAWPAAAGAGGPAVSV
jgi:SAM-dependent methyltransferase